VLIAEPSRAVCLAVGTLLKKIGLTSDCAKNVDQALSLMKQIRYDVAIIGSAMGGQDRESLLQTFHDAGISTLELAKPLDGQSLKEMIVRALADGSQGARALPLIDFHAMAELWPERNDPLLGRVVSIFISESQQRNAAIKHALDPLDRQVLRHEAHSLRGAAANVCARRLEKTSAELESLANAASGAVLSDCVERLGRAMAETVPALSAHFDPPTG
jgi:HPt (histidine-containing phosphotransfer) domain-containing protein